MDKETQVEILLSQYGSEVVAWKSWGIDAVEKTHNLKVQIVKEIIALIPDKPEGEPPLLSDVEIHKYYLHIKDPFIPRYLDTGRQNAQAQREADIKWYGGK